MESGKEFEVYSDIGKRTNGEIYIGVVGPVRTGKSTFIKRFMDLCVLPNMLEEYEKKQTTEGLQIPLRFITSAVCIALFILFLVMLLLP